MKRSVFLIAPALAVLALSACGDVREDLGLGRSAPDEFAVVDRAPLSMPPDFTLRPPQPGEQRPQEVDLTQKANNIVFGGNPNSTNAAGTATPTSMPNAVANPQAVTASSGAEKELLTATSADKADPNIRTTVDREAAEKVVGTAHLVDDLLWWKKNEKPVATVDAAAEAARIKEAQAKGQPLNQSATPVIEKEKTGWLGL
jgi:hypothetical protein